MSVNKYIFSVSLVFFLVFSGCESEEEHPPIIVTDTKAPVFTSPNSFTVDDGELDVGSVVATDSSAITYSISGTNADSFNINSATGKVTFKTAADSETKNNYIFTVHAIDSSSNETTQDITVYVSDVFITQPTMHLVSFISSNTVSVYENQTAALTVDAIGALFYAISGEDASYFTIDANTGVITFKVAPDYETKQNYSLIVTAENISMVSPDGTQDISIIILDVDEQTSNDDGTYQRVISPYTGKAWLDRNLGASRACQAIDDESCFGDYYQWGRDTDGHEKLTSSTQNTKASDFIGVGANFIHSSDDWTTSDSEGMSRTYHWSQGVDVHGICPTGYRVPTGGELYAETDGTIYNRIDMYNSFLKLPTTGFRSSTNSSIADRLSSGYLWSASADGTNSQYIYFNDDSTDVWNTNIRARGLPIRCIEN